MKYELLCVSSLKKTVKLIPVYLMIDHRLRKKGNEEEKENIVVP